MKTVYAYAICAGWITLAATVQADIVWSGEQNLSGYEQPIDLNSDSLTDVVLLYQLSGDDSGNNGYLDAKVDGSDVHGSNRILVYSSNGYDAALPLGTLISASPDSSLEWGGGTSYSGRVSDWASYSQVPGTPPDTEGEWRGLLGENGNTYIGIEFEVEGAIHYGWVNIALGEEGALGVEDPITTSWAYESTPGAPISAGAIPEPSTGILSVLGAGGLLYLRRLRNRGKQNLPHKRHSLQPEDLPEKW